MSKVEKIAVLADVHGNLAALEAVVADIERWSPDRVIFAGDIVNRGPQSLECARLLWELQRRLGWLLMQGNHEEYMLLYERDRHLPHLAPGMPRYEVSRPNIWTWSKVRSELAHFAQLPTRIDLDLAGAARLVVLHASVRHNRDGLLARFSDDELRAQLDPQATIFCTGHTHMPFVREVGSTLVVNVGAVGLPFDGDTRAAYAQLSRWGGRWHAAIARVAYDLAATEHAIFSSGMFDGIGAVAPIMLRELQTASSLMFDFAPAYNERLLAGTMTLTDAVAEFMGRLK